MAGYGNNAGAMDMEEDSSKPMDSDHHEFKAAHHMRMAKLHHGIAKAHEMVSAHHSKMAGNSQEDDGELDAEGGDEATSAMPMSFGRGA